MKYADHIHEIHKSMRPFMLRRAHKYRLHNPAEFADEWLTSAYFIAKRFDDGEIPLIVDGAQVLPTDFGRADALAQFGRYLRTCYVNSVTQEYNSKRRTVYIDEDRKSACVANIRNFDALRISHLLSQAETDASIKSRYVAEEVSRILYECAAEVLRTLMHELGDIEVTPDISNPRSEVNSEFRQEFTNALLSKMLQRAIDETQPMLFDKLFNLVYSPANNAMIKRISRWLDSEDGALKRIAAAHNQKSRRRRNGN